LYVAYTNKCNSIVAFDLTTPVRFNVFNTKDFNDFRRLESPNKCVRIYKLHKLENGLESSNSNMLLDSTYNLYDISSDWKYFVKPNILRKSKNYYVF